MIKKFAFTVYPVKDMQRAQNFYEEIMGLKLSKSSAGGKWLEYDLPGSGCFAITTMMQGIEPSINAGGSIAFEVDNIDSMVERLKEHGVEFKMEPFCSPVCKIAVIIDSEGNALMLHQLHKTN